MDVEHEDGSGFEGHSLEITSSSGRAALCGQHAGSFVDLVVLDTKWAEANLVSGRSVLRVRGVFNGQVLTIAPGDVPEVIGVPQVKGASRLET